MVTATATAVGVASPVAMPHPVVMSWVRPEALAEIAARAPAQAAALGLGPAMGVIATSGTAAMASRSGFSATTMAMATRRAASTIASALCRPGGATGGAATATALKTK